MLCHIQTYSELCVTLAYTNYVIYLAYLEPETFSNACQTHKMIRHSKPWHRQNSWFKHFQRYLWIFRDIDAYSATLRHYSFCKMLYLKYLTVFGISLCLDNSLAICTVALCYILHQKHSEFWHHIQNSVCSGIFRHILVYLLLLRYIQ